MVRTTRVERLDDQPVGEQRPQRPSSLTGNRNTRRRLSRAAQLASVGLVIAAGTTAGASEQVDGSAVSHSIEVAGVSITAPSPSLGLTQASLLPVASTTIAALSTTATPTTATPTTATSTTATPTTLPPTTATPTTAAPTTAAPTTAAPTTAAADYLTRGAAALARISYPWQSRLSGWSVVFSPGRDGAYGYTYTDRQVIEIFVRDGQSESLLAHVIAHELGHAVDVSLNSGDERNEWLRARGIEGATWWPGNGATDFSTGAGDFAESFAAWQVGAGNFRSNLAGAPNADQLALMARLAG